MTSRVRRRCTGASSLLLLLLLLIIRLWTGHMWRLIRCLALGRGGSTIWLVLRMLGLLLVRLLLLLRHCGITGRRLLLLRLHRASTQGDGIVVAGSVAVLVVSGRAGSTMSSRGSVSVQGDGVNRKGDDEEDAVDTQGILSVYMLEFIPVDRRALTTLHRPVRQQQPYKQTLSRTRPPTGSKCSQKSHKR